MILKFTWKKIIKTFYRKKKQGEWELPYQDIRIYFKVLVTKTHYKWNKIESSETDPCLDRDVMYQWEMWKWKSLIRVWLFATPWTIWNSPGQNTGVGSLSLFQEIFPTQESNPGLLHCRQILFQLSHKGSPRTPEWVAYPFSRGSSQPRIRTGVSCTPGVFYTNWAIREAMGKKLLQNCLKATGY